MLLITVWGRRSGVVKNVCVCVCVCVYIYVCIYGDARVRWCEQILGDPPEAFCLFVEITHIYIYILQLSYRLKNDKVSGHIARQSGLNLTGSMFCQRVFSSIFSTVVWRLLLWLPTTYNLTVILEYRGRSSYDFKASVDGLGPLAGPMLTVLGRSQGLSWRS